MISMTPAFKGINLHNALWASVFSGNAGGAMIWYWDSYIHPGNLYAQYANLRRFTDTIPWNEGPWKPVTIDPPQQPNPDHSIPRSGYTVRSGVGAIFGQGIHGKAIAIPDGGTATHVSLRPWQTRNKDSAGAQPDYMKSRGVWSLRSMKCPRACMF